MSAYGVRSSAKSVAATSAARRKRMLSPFIAVVKTNTKLSRSNAYSAAARKKNSSMRPFKYLSKRRASASSMMRMRLSIGRLT